jgi:hypothetical protein
VEGHALAQGEGVLQAVIGQVNALGLVELDVLGAAVEVRPR